MVYFGPTVWRGIEKRGWGFEHGEVCGGGWGGHVIERHRRAKQREQPSDELEPNNKPVVHDERVYSCSDNCALLAGMGISAWMTGTRLGWTDEVTRTLTQSLSLWMHWPLIVTMNVSSFFTERGTKVVFCIN